MAFVEGAARKIDTNRRDVTVESGDETVKTLPYDRLILATGGELRELPISGLAENSFNIDTYDTAVALDVHLQKIVQTPDIPGHNCFVIVGAGMCGIEMSTEMRNRIELHSDAATAQAARVVLLERAEMVGPEFGDGPRPVIMDGLGQADVEIMLGTSVTRIDKDSVTLEQRQGNSDGHCDRHHRAMRQFTVGTNSGGARRARPPAGRRHAACQGCAWHLRHRRYRTSRCR